MGAGKPTSCFQIDAVEMEAGFAARVKGPSVAVCLNLWKVHRNILDWAQPLAAMRLSGFAVNMAYMEPHFAGYASNRAMFVPVARPGIVGPVVTARPRGIAGWHKGIVASALSETGFGHYIRNPKESRRHHRDCCRQTSPETCRQMYRMAGCNIGPRPLRETGRPRKLPMLEAGFSSG